MDFRAAHYHSFKNEQEILTSGYCGCFYCKTFFTNSAVLEWVDEEDAQKTAMCPNCGIDSVIGDKSGFPVTDAAFLSEMKRIYFW